MDNSALSNDQRLRKKLAKPILKKIASYITIGVARPTATEDKLKVKSQYDTLFKAIFFQDGGYDKDMFTDLARRLLLLKEVSKLYRTMPKTAIWSCLSIGFSNLSSVKQDLMAIKNTYKYLRKHTNLPTWSLFKLKEFGDEISKQKIQELLDDLNGKAHIIRTNVRNQRSLQARLNFGLTTKISTAKGMYISQNRRKRQKISNLKITEDIYTEMGFLDYNDTSRNIR